jgi:hypothetical protein
MNAKKLVEMAMDPGEGGHLIDPKKRRDIDARKTPLSKNPAFPEGEYGDKIATQAYGKVLQGAGRAMGQDARNLRPEQIMQALMRTVNLVVQKEDDYRSELEELAVAIVLDLPEFKDARDAYIDGKLRINAQLLPEMPEQMNAQNMANIEPEEPSEEESSDLGLDVPEIKAQFDQEVNKRKFINILIQGAAVNKTHAYHLASERLNEIDPDLIKLYGKMTALGDLSYWMKPEDVFGGKHGGQESIEVEQDDDGEDVYTINATAINFPLLIHELTKGLYEVVFHNVIEDPSTRARVYKDADTLSQEEWGIMKGPAVWMHFNHLVNKIDAAQYIPRILNHLTSLSADEFAGVVRSIFSETPEGLRYLKQTVDDIKAEDEAQNEET